MSTARIGMAGGRSGGESGSGAGRWLAIAVLLLVLGLVAAWWFGLFERPLDPRVAEIQKVQEEAMRQFAATGGPSTPAEAAASVEASLAIMEKVRALPKEAREQLDRSGRFVGNFSASIDRYFDTPPARRQAELDRQIKQSELMRQAWESSRGASSGDGDARRGTGGGGGRGGGGPRGQSEEERNRWRKSMIDRTSPAQRARYVEYRRAMDKRRQELGLPATGPR